MLNYGLKPMIGLTMSPNKKTRAAIEELESGKGQRYKTMNDVWDSLDDA